MPARRSSSSTRKSSVARSSSSRRRPSGSRSSAAAGKGTARAHKKPVRSAAGSSRGRRYGARASQDVEQAMHELKHGQLKMGRSRRKVTDPRQAIAIGLAKARREGARVPPPRARARGRKR